jgi:hypothetical protein
MTSFSKARSALWSPDPFAAVADDIWHCHAGKRNRKGRGKNAKAAGGAAGQEQQEDNDDGFDLELEAALQDDDDEAAPPPKKQPKKGASKSKVPDAFDMTGLPPAARAVVVLQAQKEHERVNVRQAWMSLLDDPA